MKKTQTTIIGGADGPTSVFLVGSRAGKKDKNILRRIKSTFLNKRYKQKRKAAERQISAGAHTLAEVMCYIRQRYGAVEADSSCPYYEERKSSMKYELIQREMPKLLGEVQTFLPPEDFNDSQAVKEWHTRLTAWVQEQQKKADEVPDNVFPTDYHMFLINRGEQGTLEIELDTLHPNISVSYSGDKKAMEAILKDIHLYYGVSQEDIDHRTERYHSLVAALSLN